MSSRDHLLLQAIIICLVPAPIGITAVVKHQAWFGRVPESAAFQNGHLQSYQQIARAVGLER